VFTKFQQMELGNSALNLRGNLSVQWEIGRFLFSFVHTYVDLHIVGDLYDRLVRLCSIPDCIPSLIINVPRNRRFWANTKKSIKICLQILTVAVFGPRPTITYKCTQYNTRKYDIVLMF
jgi:hypothetical protein